MPLPTLDKTWQFNVNSAAITAYNVLLYNIKAALIGFGSFPWTVVSSSDSVSAGVGDKWLSAANVIWNVNTSPHSWIVLKQIGIGSNFQILLECWRDAGGGSKAFRFFCSTSVGFSGGTTSSRPTATDETDLNCGGVLELTNLYDLAVNPARLHAMQSTDGECTRWIVCVNNTQSELVVIDKSKSPISGWSPPWIAIVAVNLYNSGLSTDCLTYGRFNDSDTRSFARFGSVNANLYLASEGYGTATVGENFAVPDDDTGEWPMCPISLASDIVGARGGIKGMCYDFWWGAVTPVTGDCYPADGTRQFVQFADVILPWNGSVPLVA